MCKVSLITLCYNQCQNATKPMLESLYKFTNQDLFELIVVNNASTDETKDFVEDFSKKYNNVTLINNEENFGFAKGMNQGLKIAKGEFIFLLNNDLLFTPNWLEKFIDILSNNEEIGLISCKTNYCGEDYQLIEDADKINMANYLEKVKPTDKNRFEILEKTRVVFFCIGLTKKSFEKIGYLDEKFGLAWFEDDDYTMRTLYSGLKIAIAQDIFIFHNHSQTTSQLTKSKEGKKLFERNKKYFENKHHLYKILKKQAEINIKDELKKIKTKHKKYKKLFSIFLATALVEFAIILTGILYILIKIQ